MPFFTPRLPASYEVTILAPGFARETRKVSADTELTVNLRLATASETVVVSATRTAVPGEAAGADVDTLSGAQLTTMQPVAANDAMRFLPGAVVNTAGQRGGLSSLFVRGGESNYNKVIVDGVTVNEPGGTFDFGTLSLAQADRVEFVRGAQSTLYGSDAMTSVIQVWTRAGSTRVPELRFGADGGNLETASGHASLAGARGRIRLQRFRRSIQYKRLGHQRRIFRILQGANVGIASQRFGFTTRARSPLQQPYWRSGRVEFQRRPLLEPFRIQTTMVPAQQCVRQRGTGGRCARMDGSITSPDSTTSTATTS